MFRSSPNSWKKKNNSLSVLGEIFCVTIFCSWAVSLQIILKTLTTSHENLAKMIYATWHIPYILFFFFRTCLTSQVKAILPKEGMQRNDPKFQTHFVFLTTWINQKHDKTKPREGCRKRSPYANAEITRGFTANAIFVWQCEAAASHAPLSGLCGQERIMPGVQMTLIDKGHYVRPI